MRAAQKISGYFEYFEYWSDVLDVTSQPVLVDLTVHL
jgi:hypothetical protein